MSDLRLTRTALRRYRECVADLPAREVWLALDCPAVRAAREFGARFVRLSGGQRVVLQDNCIVTILPSNYRLLRLCRQYDGERYEIDGGSHAQG